MPTRYIRQLPQFLDNIRVRPFSAIRQKFKEGYTKSDLRADVMSGIIVALVALPLGMALAIATGVPPQQGLYTIVIAGIITPLMGGSRFQVTGPTAAFVVVLAPIVAKYGLSGLIISGGLAGIMLVGMGAFRMGQLIQFIPHPVTTGFTSGIAVVIATIQLKDLFGLQFTSTPETFIDRVIEITRAFKYFSPIESALGLTTLGLLILWPKISKRVPAPIVVLTFVTVTTALLSQFFPSLSFATIGNQFVTTIHGTEYRGIPPLPPIFIWPWEQPGPEGGHLPMTAEIFQQLTSAAFAIAMLAAIESLLSAVVADGMAKTHHDPDSELIALGTGNIANAFFGGIPATGAIARTATNINFGARSPISAIIHGFIVLLALLFLAPWVGYLPMASLAALLLIVAYNMADLRHFSHIVKVAPRSDVAVLLICFFLTVFFDMVIGVSVGFVLATVLFMRRMSYLVQGVAMPLGSKHSRMEVTIPNDVLLYEIIGPMFFGAAQKAIDALETTQSQAKTIVIDLDQVPVMDVTGLVALETAIQGVLSQGRKAVVAGLRPQPLSLIQKSEVLSSGRVHLYKDVNEAISALQTRNL